MTTDFLARLFDVSGKRALVTGATSGIGLMIAKGLVSAGVEVWVTARNENDVQRTVKDLGSGAHGVVANLTTDEGIATVSSTLGNRALNILVNNAGTDQPTPLAADGKEDFESVLAINLTAPFILTRKLIPNLERAATRGDPARVINISSIAALLPGPRENFAYAPSKAGVVMLTRQLGHHLAKRNISCNAIAPGLFPSRMSERFLGMGVDDAPPPALVSPIDSRAGEIEDITGAVIYLSSRAGAWVTGAHLPVSGGVSTVS